MKWIFLVLIFLMGNLVLAQGERPDRPEYMAQSRLLTLRIVPKDREAKLFFAGRKLANIDLEKDHKLLKVTALKFDQTENLLFSKEGEAYVIKKMPDWKEPYELVVRSETKGKIENIRVHIKNEKP